VEFICGVPSGVQRLSAISRFIVATRADPLRSMQVGMHSRLFGSCSITQILREGIEAQRVGWSEILIRSTSRICGSLNGGCAR